MQEFIDIKPVNGGYIHVLLDGQIHEMPDGTRGHNLEREAYQHAYNLKLSFPDSIVTIQFPDYEVEMPAKAGHYFYSEHDNLLASMSVTEQPDSLSAFGGGAVVYSGNELFISDMSTPVGRNDTDFRAKFIANGFDHAKSQPVDTGSKGYVYTATGAEVPGNPLINTLPSGKTNCLAMESAGYSLAHFDENIGISGEWYGQTDFYVQVFGESYPVGTIPPDVWFQFWVYHPDQLTDDVPVYSGYYWVAGTYINATTFDVPDYLPERYYVGREIRFQNSSGANIVESTVASVSYSSGITRVVITDAVLDSTHVEIEHKTNTKGYSEGKYLYATRWAGGWPGSCSNDGFVWIVGTNKNNLAGLDGIDPCGTDNTIACDSQFLAGSFSYSGCGGAVIDTNDESNDLANNLSSEPDFVPGQWTLVKIHIDVTGTNANCSPGQLAFEKWIKRYGDTGFTKTAEWYGGTTMHNGSVVTLTPTFTDGCRGIVIPSTLGGALEIKANWFDSLTYMDDFCMCASEADLPVYG